MPTLNIKNVPPDLYDRLKDNAQRHRRSINSEAIVCLEGALKSTRVDPDALLERIDRLRDQLDLAPLTDDLLDRSRNEGRP